MPLSENDAAAAAHYETVTDTLKLISDYTRLNLMKLWNWTVVYISFISEMLIFI